jgi:hypothetical protein
MPKFTPKSESRLSTVQQALDARAAAGLVAAESSILRLPDHLGLCLDISGSMAPLVPSVVKAYNSLLTAFPGSNITRVMFGSNVAVPVRNSPAGALLPMTQGEYELSGQTSLLDGFGDCIKEVGAVYDPPPRLAKPRVLIALLTDGAENASHRFTADDIRLMVGYRRVTCNWQFIYLCADGTDYGLRLGIPATHIASFNDPDSLERLLERLQAAINAYTLGDRNFIRFLKEKN